jgi:hypothetical protein
METELLGMVEVNERDEVSLNERPLPLGPGDARLPVILGPDRRLTTRNTSLCGRAIVIINDHGDVLYAFDFKRRGHYLLGKDCVMYFEPACIPLEFREQLEKLSDQTAAAA